MAEHRGPPSVVKVGGSLFDLPDFGPRLKAWLAFYQSNVILVPGGGALTECIRDYDRLHQLGEEACHWLALRTLHVNAHFLAHLLGGVKVVSGPEQHAPDMVSIMDMFAFALADEARPGRLPHHWQVTSDSLALRLAMLIDAPELVLLKSVNPAAGTTWDDAARQGIVDGHFCEMMLGANPGLRLRVVNLRQASGAG